MVYPAEPHRRLLVPAPVRCRWANLRRAAWSLAAAMASQTLAGKSWVMVQNLALEAARNGCWH